MKIYRITDRRDFMNKLLNSECFDSFLLNESTIKMANSYVITGKLNREFYTTEEQQDETCCPYDYSQWKDLRPLCFQLLKGKKTPISLQIILLLKPEYYEKVMNIDTKLAGDCFVSHFLVTIKFDQNGLFLTSGISYTSFTMNKEPELSWDKALTKFLLSKQISFEE